MALDGNPMSLLDIGPLRRVRHRAVHGWPARRGSTINYHSFRIHGTKAPPDVPGIYIVAKADAGQWFPLLIGETTSVALHLAAEDRLAKAVEHGATAVHVLEERDPQARHTIEQELLRSLQPPLNGSASIRSLINRLGRRPH